MPLPMRGGEQLDLVELVPRFLGRDQAGEQIVARRRAALRDEAAEVVGQRLPGGDAAAPDLGIRSEPDQVEAARDVEAPPLEALVVLDGHAEHLADHHDRNRVRELLDEVHRAARGHTVEQAVDDLLDPWPQSLDHARRERLADEPAQPRVIRRIAVEHRQAHRGHGGAEARGHEGRDRFLGQARVAQRRHHVVVPRQHPEAERTVMDGILGAQAVVRRVGIRHERRIHRVELDVGHQRTS